MYKECDKFNYTKKIENYKIVTQVMDIFDKEKLILNLIEFHHKRNTFPTTLSRIVNLVGRTSAYLVHILKLSYTNRRKNVFNINIKTC